MCFKEDEERILSIINIVNREVEAGLEPFFLHDGPVEGEVETVVRLETVGVAVAVLGGEGAADEVVADGDRN